MLEGPYRAGPWPGLTARGAAILLGCALLLAIGQVLIGPIRGALPDLPVLAVTTLFPLAIATRIVQAPGAASATCGAYLLPRTLLSLIQPAVPLPPLLLVPALAFDVAVWLRPLTRGRAAMGGAAYGLTLCLAEPPFAILLGGEPGLWSGVNLLVAGVASVLVCAAVAPVSVRGTG
jgi:hypothetical protein